MTRDDLVQRLTHVAGELHDCPMCEPHAEAVEAAAAALAAPSAAPSHPFGCQCGCSYAAPSADLVALVREWQAARKPTVLATPGEFLAETFQAAVRRMSAADEALPLSKLVARGVKRCREMGAHLLVSFADATQGHHGGVYQACGWHYGGQREPRMDGLLVRGAFVPGRVANHRWGTQSPAKLADMGVDVVPHYDMGKHLYWKALDATGETWAHDLRLRTLAYPKPARTA